MTLDLTQVSVEPLLQLSGVCASEVTETAGPALPQRGSAAGDYTPPPAAATDITRAGDGVARRGAASHPQAGSRQERRGGEAEPAHGVQVGIPHTGKMNGRFVH